MDAFTPMNPQMLDEDLQIVRATLATITEDVHRLSPAAGQALDEARAKLDQAHAEFVRPSRGRAMLEPGEAVKRPSTGAR